MGYTLQAMYSFNVYILYYNKYNIYVLFLMCSTKIHLIKIKLYLYN